MKYVFSLIFVSYLKSILLPPDSAVYTPSDGDNWMLAKLNVQITDIGYAQIAEHLARVRALKRKGGETARALLGDA